MSHRFRLDARFGDFDAAGIVYYPRYLHFCHVGMEEYFRHVVGIDYPDVNRITGFGDAGKEAGAGRSGAGSSSCGAVTGPSGRAVASFIGVIKVSRREGRQAQG